MKAPIIEVGIFSRKAISFSFNDNYIQNKKNTLFQGGQRVLWEKGKIIFEGNSYDELLFEPVSQEATFDLESVTIGVDFHWQREETQRFPGALKLLATEEGILAINRVDAERYLSCVISSEMNAEAPEEFLKAHAVISRSWLLSQLEKITSFVGTTGKTIHYSMFAQTTIANATKVSPDLPGILKSCNFSKRQMERC
mgnify:CR=1 FL=1